MTKPQFSIAALLAAKAADTWARQTSVEYLAHRELCDRFGEPSSQAAVRLPPGALDTRDMTVSGVSGSQYLAGTRVGEYLPSLQPYAAPLALGAQVLSIDGGHVTYPVGGTAAVASWLSDENSAPASETQPTIGSTAATPKTLAAFAHVTHQALRQSNAEQVVRLELARAAGAAVTAAILQGTGTLGQPIGITKTAGVGTYTGAAQTQAHLRNGQAGIAAAILNPGAVGMITTPAVAEVLTTRQRFTGSDRALWEGPSHDGLVEGVRALSTAACSAATEILGDWSLAWIVEWAGGAQIQVDPFTYFDSGVVQVRLLLLVDVLFPRPAAFAVATSVS